MRWHGMEWNGIAMSKLRDMYDWCVFNVVERATFWSFILSFTLTSSQISKLLNVTDVYKRGELYTLKFVWQVKKEEAFMKSIFLDNQIYSSTFFTIEYINTCSWWLWWDVNRIVLLKVWIWKQKNFTDV